MEKTNAEHQDLMKTFDKTIQSRRSVSRNDNPDRKISIEKVDFNLVGQKNSYLA